MHKKILFLISRFLDGGIDTVLVEVLRMLAEDPRYRLTLAIAVKMEGLEVYHHRLPENVRVEYLVDAPWLCTPKVRRFKKQSSTLEKAADELFINPIRRHKQQLRVRQLIEANDVVVDFDACQTAFLKGCSKPTVAWMHFSLRKLLEQNRRRTERIVKRLEGYGCTVLICKAMQQEADSMFPSLQGRTACVYNALDVTALRQRAQQDIGCTFPYLLAVERLEESQKDISTLLEAYARLKTDRHLVIIGKGKDEDRLKRHAESLGLAVATDLTPTAQVHFLGFKANPHAWMARAEMLVHSAKFEGFGLAIAEAMLLGKPVVASDCPVGPREILDEGRAGLLVPVGDAEAIALAINRLLSDEKLRREMLSHAAEYGKRFTKDMVKPQLDNLFGL